MLTAGLRTESIHKQLLNPKPVKDAAIAWREGKFHFEESPVRDVLRTLEMQFDVKIIYAGDSDRMYTGFFTNTDLDEALKLICLPLQLDYRIINNKEIKISPNKKS